LKLLLATHNDHKRVEFERVLERAGGAWQLDALPADVVMPPEDGDTFAENALGKARAAAAATGRVSIADDSGIEAASLGGAPGVRSARYAGEHATDAENLRKLLSEAEAGSALEYVCVIAYVDPASRLERVCEGRCAGRLAEQPRGEGGFGYDPAFVPDELPPAYTGEPAPTMAELSPEQKDAISHRGRAARALIGWLAGEREREPSAGNEQRGGGARAG
jgi:XTP/dITP diphosphohydrolase